MEEKKYFEPLLSSTFPASLGPTSECKICTWRTRKREGTERRCVGAKEKPHLSYGLGSDRSFHGGRLNTGMCSKFPFPYFSRANLQVFFTLGYTFFEGFSTQDTSLVEKQFPKSPQISPNFQSGSKHSHYLVTNQVILGKKKKVLLLCYLQQLI